MPDSDLPRTLVLGLGNDILADDAVGLRAVRMLRGRTGPGIVVEESSMHGLALLDLFIGYERAVLIDAVHTGRHPPGTILEMSPSDLAPAGGTPSPHFCGLPEMIDLAARMELDFPRRFHIVAVEIGDALTIGGAMSAEIEAAVPELCRLVMKWLAETTPGPA